MKAEELQIGNWVNFPNKYGEPQYYRISGIEKSKNKSSEDIDQFYFEVPPGKPSCGTLGMNLKPIPITAEILERNGFTKEPFVSSTHYYCNYNESHIRAFKIHGEDDVYVDAIEPHTSSAPFINPARLKYIHELQQAIRLCGIDKEIEL